MVHAAEKVGALTSQVALSSQACVGLQFCQSHLAQQAGLVLSAGRLLKGRAVCYWQQQDLRPPCCVWRRHCSVTRVRWQQQVLAAPAAAAARFGAVLWLCCFVSQLPHRLVSVSCTINTTTAGVACAWTIQRG